MHTAVMGLHNLFHQSQSKPASFNRPRQLIAATIEAFKNFIDFFRLDANAEVLDSNN